MGNCQVSEVATVEIQNPKSEKTERLYWPTPAEQVLKRNPGYNIALLTTLFIGKDKENHVSVKCLKVLKNTDMLLVGQVYRLVPSKEVGEAMRPLKVEKTVQPEMMEKYKNRGKGESVKDGKQVAEKRSTDHHVKTMARARQWRPKLQSISEGLS